jgi:CRISPR-associated protein Csm2
VTKPSTKLAALIDKNGQEYAEDFADDISTSQLRQVYAAVKQAEHRYQADNDMEAALHRLRLLKPKLAYLTARDENAAEFERKIVEHIDKTIEEKSQNRLEYFFQLLEAFVGYHKIAETGHTLTREATELDHDKIEETAREHAREYQLQGVKTSQLRQVYGEIKRAQGQFRQYRDTEESERHTEEAKRLLYLLLPKLTYIAGSHEEMVNFCDDVRGWVYYATSGGEAELETFFELLEAVVAYHKYYDETNNYEQ